MSEIAFGLLINLGGILCLAAFVYLNVVLQPKWLPFDQPGTRDRGRSTAADASGSGTQMALGVVEALVFFLGVALVTAGCAIIGTSIGYGS